MATSLNNCLVGALWLMCRYRTWKLRILWRGRTVPHFYVIDRKLREWHFKLVDDVLPWPLCFFLFRGHYTRLRR